MSLKGFYRKYKKYKITAVDSGIGDFKKTLTPDGDFEGLISIISKPETIRYDNTDFRVDANLFFGVEIDLEIGSIIEDNTKYYRLISDPIDTLNRGHHKIAKLARYEINEGESIIK